MLRVYGKSNCGQCEMVKSMLTSKGILFEYHSLDYDSMASEEKDLVNKAIKEGYAALPIITKDDKFITVKEVMRGGEK